MCRFSAPRFGRRLDFRIIRTASMCCTKERLLGRGELILTTVLAQSLPTDPILVLGDSDEIQPSKINDVKKLMIKVEMIFIVIYTNTQVDQPFYIVL